MIALSIFVSSVAQSYPTVSDSMDCTTPGFPVHHQLPKLAQTHVHQVGDTSNHLILCCPLLLLPSVFPSIRVFSSESVLRIRWPKYWSFSISPSNEYSVLISIKITGLISSQTKGPSRVFSNTAIQKASILQFSAFFIVQLSYPYMTTGKTVALTS